MTATRYSLSTRNMENTQQTKPLRLVGIPKVLLAIVFAMVLAVLVPASADAAPFEGAVKEVNMYATEAECYSNQSGCPHGAGTGQANTIHVRQELVNGQWQYNLVAGTADNPADFWLHVSWHAECRRGWTLSDGSIGEGFQHGFGSASTGDDDSGVTFESSIWNLNPFLRIDTLTQSDDVPMDVVLDNLHDPVPGANWNTTEGLIAFGEALIDARMAEGMSELEARSHTESFTTEASWHAQADCLSWLGFRQHYRETYNPLEVHVVFDGVDIGIAGDFEGGLGVDTQITNALMTVETDPHDNCIVHALGTFTTNGPTTVEYSIVNTFGQKSGPYSVTVGESRVAEVSHEIAVASLEASAPEDTLTTNQGSNGEVDQLAEQPSENVNDVLQFEIVEPNRLVSNADGYSVPPCVDGGLDAPSDELVLPAGTGNGNTIEPSQPS